MRDKERGVIWEETMILLSNKINYVFLSATIPNAREFAMWICKIKNQPCNVVYTDFRPVPLQHYIYPHKGNAIYLCVDKNGKFKENNFKNAIKVLNDQLSLETISLENKKNHKKNIKISEKTKNEDDILKVVTLIIKKNLSPAIIFSFSKKECEDHALKLCKKDFTTNSEKEKISLIYNNAIETLSSEDKNSPQIKLLLPILLRGIGIHHGGMLPILKECVELIFQEGFIKILFSTETFSMGINMPAKTVVFTQIEKFDGEERRYLGGGEYIQMSGRAGRRGIDDMGISIVIFNNKIEFEKCKNILCGKADPLNSSFHFNYNQLVNLYKIEGLESEYIVKRSFRQFQSERSVPILKKELIQKYSNFLIQFQSDFEKDEYVKKFIDVQNLIDNLNKDIRDIFIKDENLIPFLVTGRLLKLYNFNYGIVIAYKMKNVEYSEKAKKKIMKSEILKGEKNEDKIIELNESDDDNFSNNLNNLSLNNNNKEEYEMTEINNDNKLLIIDVLVYLSNYTDTQNNLLPGNINEKNGKIGIIPITKDLIENLSPVKVKIPENLKDKDNLKLMENIFFSILERFEYNIKMMDPVDDMDLDNIEDNQLIREKTLNIKRLEKRKNEIESEYYNKYKINLNNEKILDFKKKKNSRQEIKTLIQKINKTEELVLQDDLISMKRVLRRLDFIENEILTQKGKIACMISGVDELLITETLFSGKFNDLSPEELASILTIYLINEGGSSGIKEEEMNKFMKYENLKKFYEDLKISAQRISDILIECKVNIDKEKYINQFKPEFIYLIYKWANQMSFNELIENSSVFEGNLVRVIKRLDEFIKSLIDCASFIGNDKLKDKFIQASLKIRRGMPFAASLYLSDEK
jgi:ATP-dependent RNA helicase DOB1